MLKPEDIKEIENYFKPRVEKGRTLPNPKSVPDDTEFLLLGEDGYYTLYRMIDGKWHAGRLSLSGQFYFKPA